MHPARSNTLRNSARKACKWLPHPGVYSSLAPEPYAQLTGQSAAIPEIFMQTPGEQPQGVTVSDLRCHTKAFVKRAANNAVMVPGFRSTCPRGLPEGSPPA